MSGTGSGDEAAILIASFVEEVKPFFSGIRRGVNGIFAMPRDTQAIAAARGSLGTLAGSAKMLDIPAAWQLAELSQLLTEGFAAAERGGVPNESRAPMLLLVDHLEAQLDSLEAPDDRGREQLDHSYRLLEQVLQTVEEAEAAPPAALEIALDDLLLTLQPASAPEPAPVVVADVIVEPTPEPTQIELQLVAEDAVAPIEWGEKEAILWNKGGWDESQTTYGNTEWIFLDEEEVTTVNATQQGAGDQPPGDRVVERAAIAPLSPADSLAADGEDTVVAAAPEGALAGTGELPDLAATGSLVAPPPESPESDDHLLIGATDSLPDHAPQGDVAEPAAIGMPAAPPAEARTDEGADAVVDAGATGVLPGVSLDAEALEEAALLALSPADLEAYMVLDDDQQATFLQERLGEMADFATCGARGARYGRPLGAAQRPGRRDRRSARRRARARSRRTAGDDRRADRAGDDYLAAAPLPPQPHAALARRRHRSPPGDRECSAHGVRPRRPDIRVRRCAERRARRPRHGE